MLSASPRRRHRGVLVALCLALAGFALPTRLAADEWPGPALAVAAELTVESGRTRLTLTLSKPVQLTTFLLERPDRAVLDLPEVNFQIDEATRRRAGLVSSFRFGLVGPGRSRIVVDLAGPATIAAVTTTDAELADATLLTIEFARADRDTFRRLASDDRADLALTTGSVAGAPTKDTRPAIAIDAGHGGTDPGAKSPSGLAEKDITLAFAQVFRDRLAEGGRYRLVMIRGDDTFVPLDERVRRAREAGADLFVSIHADTIGSPQVSGGTIYTGSDRATDVESASLAERENAADAAGGHAAAPAPPGVTDILQELTVRETRGFSHKFSGLLLRDLGRVMRFSAHPQREAGFRVLRTHDLPSVLVELGYMSNARDLDLLSSTAWRTRVATAMAAAVDRFFVSRTAIRAAMSP